ncbi:MAG TPA: hypothetical protein VFF06_36675, partial [Polyangia bacterium]|nr:hypothetical protein [Polyangia bacterium]
MKIISICLALSLTAARAAADPSVTAPHAALVDPSSSDAILFSVGLRNHTLQGSIAKLMTAFVTFWAEKRGDVHWDDAVALSLRDTHQQCACMKFQELVGPPPACTVIDPKSATQVNQTFKLKDLLRVTLNQSTGESTDAIAEHVARKVLHQPAAVSVADSERLMALFVGLMNERAHELHLDDSRWVTVHGGDVCDFAAGCNPLCKLGDCQPTCAHDAACGGGTSVRDLTALWHALTDLGGETFLGMVGARAFELDQDNASHSYFNSYSHQYWYYPGLDGDKNGGSGACPADSGSASCYIAQATRAGHPLIATALQSFITRDKKTVGKGTDDLSAMFRFGFAQVLKPRRRLSANADAIKDYALACTDGRCFTALRLGSDGFKLSVFSAAPDQNTLAELASFSDTAGKLGPVSAVDAATNKTGVLVAAVKSGQVTLGAFSVGAGGHPTVKLDGTKAVGAGSLARVVALGDDLAATAVRDAGGVIHVATWRVSSSASPFGALSSTTASGNIGSDGELVAAASPLPGASRDFLLVTVSLLGLDAWKIDRHGAITFLARTALLVGRNLSVAADGVGKFAVSFTAGIAATGVPQVAIFDVSATGSAPILPGPQPLADGTAQAGETAIAPLGPTATTSGIISPASLRAQTNEIAGPFECRGGPPSTTWSQTAPSAFLTASSRAGVAQLAAWDVPVFYFDASVQPIQLEDFRVADSDSQWGRASSIKLARVPGGKALEDRFVTGQIEGGRLKLIGWSLGTGCRGQALCGSDCVDLTTSHAHCGQCANACAKNLTCAGGTCHCPADVARDPKNCGECGHVCPGDLPCNGGRCCAECTCLDGFKTGA